MKLIEWNTIKDELLKALTISDSKKYISKLYDNIEKQKEENNSLSFVIKDIKEKGFVVKVGGLFGYISFNHMPWQYRNREAWDAVFPFIDGKVFFCKIYSVTKEDHSIILDGDIPQFKKTELIENEKYKGIIINKTIYGVFVDIGYNFNWKCGSFVGLLHKSNFESDESFDKIKIGQSIDVFFYQV